VIPGASVYLSRNSRDQTNRTARRRQEHSGMPSLGGQELIIILVIVMIIFGAGKLPELTGSLGKSIRAFKDESAGDAKPAVAAAAAAPAEATVSRTARADEF
jgi:sec-independent protein translocase protein TatA